jgi:putative MATE family efflux protein
MTRPPEEHPAAALPLEPQEGVVAIAVPDAEARAHLVEDPLARTIARLALPAVASSLLMTLFTSVDMYWVGRYVGPAALAAVSTSVFWIWFVIAIGEMVSIGLTAVASRRYGERDRAAAARIAGDALIFSLLLGTAIAAAGTLLVPTLFAMMDMPPDIARLGHRYLTAYLLGTPLVFGFFAVDAAFRASGDTRTPFALLTVSIAVTLVLDPVLILGLWGAPQMGIAGAAVATVLTRGAAFVMGFVLAVRRGVIDLQRPRPFSVGAVVRVGLPTAATGAFFSLIYVVLTRTTTQFGTPALAALGIGHRVESWLYMVGVGFGAATAAIVGQNLGAGRADRATRAGWISVGFCTALGALTGLAAFVWADPIASWFSTDPSVVAEGARYLRIAAVAQLFLCMEVVLEGALGGAGDTLPPMLASSVLTAARIPAAAWAAPRYGVAGIWWVLTITAVARALAMVLLWRSGRWQHKSL